MSKAWKLAACLAWVLTCAPLATAFGDTQFARVDTDDEDRPRALQLGISSYVSPDDHDGISVDLVGAIHIGDKSYYAELNERFEEYDALLYELVAPKGANVSEQVAKRKGLLSGAQIGMTKILDLSFQLDEIDYGKPNFVHADLTPTEFSQSMADRNESLYVYFWRIVFASIDEYAKDPLGLRDWQMLSAMVKSREDNSLKIMMAYEMANMESVQDILGDDSSSAIVGARNQRAIEVLRGQLDAGAQKIGIFYGVAHMADLENRLVNELGLTFQSTSWVDAWQLSTD
jgi:hypothetical protein